MSSDGYTSHPAYTSRSHTEAKSLKEEEALLNARRERIEESRREIPEASTKPRPRSDTKHLVSSEFVRMGVTKPAPETKRVHVIMIDNSGSNRAIAAHFKEAASYLKVNLALIDPEAQFVFVYFSDHCDGDGWWQAIDYISPTDEGEKILASTLLHVTGVSGGDAPEAHECALLKASQFDFGDAGERHLIMVSDVVGHSMGMEGDEGCRNQQSWKESLQKVEKAYTTFEFVGCGNDTDVERLQAQFINYLHPELEMTNFVSLAHIVEHQHRVGIVLNTSLFLIARHRGLQTIEAFLSRLYEKWLSDPVFGLETDKRAQEAIIRFSKYIPTTEDEVVEMMTRILSASKDTVRELMRQGAIYI